MELLQAGEIDTASNRLCVNNPVKDIKDALWKRITKQAMLDGLRFHDLRHKWATRHIEAGTDLLALKELGGWKTLEMVQRYAHPSSEYLAAQAKNIDGPSQASQLGKLAPYNELSIREEELTDCEKRENEKRICGKKSSQLQENELEIGDMKIIYEPQKRKNLLIISRLEKWYQWADLNRHARRQRILNPSCLPIPSHWHLFSLTFSARR